MSLILPKHLYSVIPLGKNLIECRKNENNVYGMSFWNIIKETREGITKGE